MMKPALTVACAFTLLATVYLSVSLIVLQPPRANYRQWTFVASVIVLQGVLTLAALHAGGPAGLRYATSAGAVALGWIGASSVYSTMSGPHFEGYALVLGSAMVVQGLLTFGVFLRWQDFRKAARQEGS